MPTKLYYFRTKKQLLKWCKERKYSLKACEEAWTGPGYYYARSRKHISKHVPHLDKRRGGKIGKGPWRHVNDIVYRIVKHTRQEVKKRVKYLVKKKKLQPKKARTFVLSVAAKRTRRLPKQVREIANYLWRHIPKKYKEGKSRRWTYIAVIALANTIYRQTKEKDIDWRSVDWVAEIDWRQGYRYAKKTVEALLGSKKQYVDIPEEEIIRRLKELERYGDIEIEIELDPTRIWELQHIG